MNKLNLIFASIIILFFMGLIFSDFRAKNNQQNQEKSSFSQKERVVRQPAVAGAFYPNEAQELAEQVDDFLVGAPIEKQTDTLLGLMVPHAGYIYSGEVAAFGFKYLQDKKIDTVILLGNSHRAYFEGAAVFDSGYFKTPLGEVEIDAPLAQAIIKESKNIRADYNPHSQEHSLEVQIPFLQRVLHNFKIVPILLGSANTIDDIKTMAEAISKKIVGKNVLVVASSDMSHYPYYEKANYADKKTATAILTGQVEELEKTIAELEKEGIDRAQTFLCAKEAVEVLMLVMQKIGVKDIKLLKYANSGDTAGDKSQVVGYATIGFFGKNSEREKQAPKEEILLNEQEQKELLKIARIAVETFIKEGRIPEFKVESQKLKENVGAFVTLKKQGQLRGCIGRFSPTDIPLYQVVSQMAIAAATEDARFYPVSKEELSELHYEISALSPLKKISDWKEIELGKHGVQVRKGSKNGVFLPQVATETGWDLDRFMGELCSQKAGLPWDCWKQKDVELYAFTAQVFNDEQK